MAQAWRYEPSTKTIRSVPENYWIASMDSCEGAVDHEENARLIAAAPMLLSALRGLLNGPGEGYGPGELDKAFEAVHAATGLPA